MSEEFQIEQSLSQKIIGNVIWNFFGQIWILVISFFATPFIVRSLNVNLYGIYTLTGAIIGYFYFLKLGLGPASVKYISQYLANREDDNIRRIFWSCLFAYIFLGFLGTIVIASTAHILVAKFFKIPNELKAISIFTLRLASVGFLLSMLLLAIIGIFQAIGRFDILNRIGIILGTLQIVTTVIILKLGFSLKEIIISSLVIQAIGIFIYWLNARKLLPFLARPSWDILSMIKLLKFGGFLTISAIVDPILLNIEKIFLVSLQSISILTYYAVPFSLMDRLTIIRSSFSAVLFPTFSYFQNLDKERINEDLHYASTLYILFLYMFFIFFFIVFGRPFLASWIGNDFALSSTNILIILSLAGLINAIAAPSLVALQGMDKPQLPATFHLIETIIYIPLSFLLIYKFGGIGAATAWLIRVLLDTVLLHKASCDLLGVRIFMWYRKLFYRGFLPLLIGGLSFWLLKSLNLAFLSLPNIFGIFLIFILYSYAVWKWGLDDFSREKVRVFLKSLLYCSVN